MKLEEMIKKVETIERDAYQLCQKMSDLRVLIVGLYDERDWWREMCYNAAGDDPDEPLYTMDDLKKKYK